MSDKQITDVLKQSKKLDLKTSIFLMVGLPGESKVKFLETVSLAAKLDANFEDLSVFFPYHGTDLYNVCKREGYFPKRRVMIEKERKDTILDMPDFKREEIIHLYNNFSILKELSKEGGWRVKNWHRKYLFWLMSQTPIDSTYVFARFLWNADLFVKGIRVKIFNWITE